MADTDPTSARMVAASGPAALIAFFICGFAFHGWAWAWIFFLVPGVLRAWAGPGRSRPRAVRDHPRDDQATLPPGHVGTEGPPPPQRYEG